MIERTLYGGLSRGEYMEDDRAYSGAMPEDVEPQDQDQRIVNPDKLGNLIRGARTAAGCTNDTAFAAMVKQQARLETTETILYNLQAGKRGPSLTEAVAIVAATHLKGGMHTLLEAYDPRLAEIVRRLDDTWTPPADLTDLIKED